MMIKGMNHHRKKQGPITVENAPKIRKELDDMFPCEEKAFKKWRSACSVEEITIQGGDN